MVDDTSLDSSVSSEGFISGNESGSDEDSIIDTNENDENCNENDEEMGEDGIQMNHTVFHPTYTNVEWVKGVKGSHDPIPFDGPITHSATTKRANNGMANPGFFPSNPTPVECFFAMIPVTFFDDVAKWTKEKMKMKKYFYKDVNRDDILGVICMWFIMGMISLPSVNSYYKLGIGKILGLLKLERRDMLNLPNNLKYNQVACCLQYNAPIPKCDRNDVDGKRDFYISSDLYLK